jgi:predicted phage-related endonuclease
MGRCGKQDSTMNIAVTPPLTRISITPDNEAHWLSLRTQDLTSTDVAALFGLSPYKTLFELHHEKLDGKVVRIDDNDRMLWGRRLQDAIAFGIAEDQGLEIRPMLEYIRLPDQRIGSSFDYAIEGVRPGSIWARYFDQNGPGILEIKNVDWLAFRKGWTVEDDYVEAPAHIEIQTQHQQLVSGREWSLIGALVGGNRYEILQRAADPQVHAGILAAARQFWSDLKAGIAPPPVMPDDAAAVIAMNQYAAPGKLLDARGNPAVIAAVAEYAAASARAKEAEEAKQVAKADLLLAIGDAEKVLVDGYSVSAGLVGPAMIEAFERKGYRNLRVTKKKVA